MGEKFLITGKNTHNIAEKSGKLLFSLSEGGFRGMRYNKYLIV